jgi:enoyl-CoA hydratase/carnithine racemase
MSAFETILYEKRDEHIAYITLNRPDALNSYNIQMRDDLYEVLSAVQDDSEIRVIVLNSSCERAFCAGADLSEFLSAPSPVAARRVRFNRDVWSLFLNISQPLIAQLHGYVLGSGIEMSLCCDIRVASDDAKLGLPEVALGIIPAAGGTQTLPRIIGRAKAMELLLTNRWISGKEAFEIGLVNQVVPKENLSACVEELAHKIASFKPAAVRNAKQAVVRGLDMPLQQGLTLEKCLAARCRPEG